LSICKEPLRAFFLREGLHCTTKETIFVVIGATCPERRTLHYILRTLKVSTLRAGTLERRIVMKYDVAAPFTLVPVSTGNSGHDFEMRTFDAVRAANDGPRLWHAGRAGEGAQLRIISNTLSKLNNSLSRGLMLCMFDILQTGCHRLLGRTLTLRSKDSMFLLSVPGATKLRFNETR
jgi:hypothetical protein